MRELLRKRDFLIKVNKPPRCHNPFSHHLPSYLFTANDFIWKMLFKLNSIFCLHSTVVTLWKPNPFNGMKRFRREKSPWIKSKTKQGPKMKKTNEFHSNRRQNLAESDKGLWFHQPSDSKVDSASSLDVPGVSRKKT